MRIKKALPTIFILSILTASVTFGVVDATRSNETWENFKKTLNAGFNAETHESTESVAPQNSPFEEIKKPLLFKPVRLFSDDLSIDVSLEEVTVDENGTLGVPTNWYNGGWFEDSAKVGEHGNIIIDGHYDTNTGAAAAFWSLKNLKVNDTVFLVDEVGRNFSYQVTSLVYVDIQDSSRIDILNQSEGETLTLVTCGGIWSPIDGTYNKRLIVKAQRNNKLAGAN